LNTFRNDLEKGTKRLCTEANYQHYFSFSIEAGFNREALPKQERKYQIKGNYISPGFKLTKQERKYQIKGNYIGNLIRRTIEKHKLKSRKLEYTKQRKNGPSLCSASNYFSWAIVCVVGSSL